MTVQPEDGSTARAGGPAPTPSTPSWAADRNRWLMLAPAGTRPVPAEDRWSTATQLRALPAGTPVAVTGRRGLRSLARQSDVRICEEFVALPGLERPIVVTGAGLGLRWVARSVLTVPSGVTRAHLAATVAVRLSRRAPWLLRTAGGRILLGVRQ